MIGIKTLDRYLLREILVPLGAGLGVFTFALVAARLPKLVELIVNHGLGPIEILRMVGYTVPALLESTFPMTILLGVLLGFGRLSSDQELTAVRACGVSLYRLSAPVLAFALLACPVESWLAISVRPWGNARLGEELYRAVRTHAMAGLKPKIFNDRFPGIVMYVDDVGSAATTLDGVLITDSRDPGHPSTIVARTGLVMPNERQGLITLRLLDGSVFGSEPGGRDYHVDSFALYDVTIHPVENFGVINAGPKEMRYRELSQWIAERRAAGKPDFEAETEMARKFTIPVATLLFAILGVALGIKPARGGQSERCVLSIGLFVTYFFLMRTGQTLAEMGKLNALLAMSIPDVLFAALALRLFYRAANDRTDHARGPGHLVWEMLRYFERSKVRV